MTRKHRPFQTRCLLTTAFLLLAVPASAQTGVGIEGDVDTGLEDVQTDVSGDVDAAVDPNASADVVTEATGTVEGQGWLDSGLGARSALETTWSGPQVSTSLEADARADLVGSDLDRLQADARAQATARATEAGLFGSFEQDGTVRTGAFSALRVDGSAFADHRAGGEAFLARIEARGPAEDALDLGSTVHVWTDEAHMRARDDAEGTLAVTARSQTHVAFDLAADARARFEGDIVWLSQDGRLGALVILGDGGFEAQGEGRLRATLEQGAAVRFQAHAQGDEAEWAQEQRAFAAGRLGARAGIVSVQGEAVASVESYAVDLVTDHAVAGEVRVRASSQDPDPRVVVFELDAALFASGDITLSVDGETATRHDDSQEVYADAEARTTVYHITRIENHYEATVHLAGFSEHELVFQERAEPAPGGAGPTVRGQDAPGLPLALVMGAAAIALVRRRS